MFSSKPVSYLHSKVVVTVYMAAHIDTARQKIFCNCYMNFYPFYHSQKVFYLVAEQKVQKECEFFTCFMPAETEHCMMLSTKPFFRNRLIQIRFFHKGKTIDIIGYSRKAG